MGYSPWVHKESDTTSDLTQSEKNGDQRGDETEMLLSQFTAGEKNSQRS